MALVVADRVKETTTSTGTGAISLAGAEPNFRTFASVLSDADTTYYAIIDDNNLAFEVGLGTYASSGNTITRTTVLASSNSNNAVNFSAGTKDVFLTYPADKSVNRDASGNVSVSGGVTATSFTGPVTATQVDLTAQGDLRLQDSSGGQYVALQAPATVGSSFTFTLPSADGSASQLLQTDGSGNLSFTSINASPSFTATASGAIANGDPVILNTAGTVSAVAGRDAASGSNTDFPGSDTIYLQGGIAAVFDSSNSKFVIFYSDAGNSNYGTAVVATVSGTSISYGTPVTFDSVHANDISAAFDSSNNKAVVSYQNVGQSNKGYAVVGTVSGTSISFGTPVEWEAGATSYTATTFDSNSNKVVVAGRDAGNSQYGTARVGTVSGTSISFGTAVVFETADTQFIGSTFDSTNNKVVIVYADGGNSTRPTAIVGTVSGTDISFGTAVEISTENNTNSLQRGVAFDSTNGKVLVTYAAGGTSGGNVQFKSAVGTVSGTSISFGDQVTIDSDGLAGASNGGQNSMAFDSAAGKMIVAYPDAGNSNKLTIVAGTISGTTVTYEDVAVHDNNGTGSITASAIDPSSGAFLTALRSGADSDKGKGIVNKISFTNLTGNNFVGISDAAYSDGNTATIQIAGAIDDAQSSLTIGQNYFVTTGGTIATTGSAFAGKAISATELAVKYPIPTLELISQVTASGSTEIDLTGMSSAYQIYKVYFKGFPSTSMALQIRFFTNGVIGTSSNTYAYLGIFSTSANNASSVYDSPYTNDKIKWDGSSNWNDQFVGELTINASRDSSYGGVIATGNLAALFNTGGLRNSPMTMVHNSGTSQITGIRLYPSSGNFSTGEFYLFGVKG
tara:strand:+ start:5725 stop:8271 length:2547 start_codon:yes stop_codon:yes gene_type:complete